MKRILLSLCVAMMGLTFSAVDVQAKRLGGGGYSGMKRQAPPPKQASPEPAAPAATPGTAGAAAAPAAAAPRRSWMGPIAGLAAGLGLAALMSHLGLGAAFGNFLTMVLLVVGGFLLVRFLMRRFGAAGASRHSGAPAGMQYAGWPAGQNAGSAEPRGTAAFGSGRGASSLSPLQAASTAAAAAPALPAGFDAPAFERIAKLIFIRMQAANDTGDLADLRQFATPEMFATFKLDLQDRQGAAQQTDVLQLDAQVLAFEQEEPNQIVSVRFHGLIREEADADAQSFDEVWHLVKPIDGSREWAIAGIAQNAAA